MKQERDINRMRNIIKYIKEKVDPGGSIDNAVSPVDMYHIHLLRDAGFIECNVRPYKGGAVINKIYINNAGHDFYDSVSDDRVWKEVEKEVEKEGKKLSDIALPILLQISYKVAEAFFESNS